MSKRKHLARRVRNLPTVNAHLVDAMRIWFRPPPKVGRAHLLLFA